MAGDAITANGRMLLCLWLVATTKFCDVGALLSGTAIGAYITGHVWLSGVVLGVLWLAGTLRGFNWMRRARVDAYVASTDSRLGLK